jgi:hypothetical protein
MPGPGGRADKLGNHYEAIWTVDALLDVFEGQCRSITIEAFGDESVGVEFHLTLPDGRLQFHSLKRQKQGGDWSVADLCRAQDSTGRSILGDLSAKLLLNPNCELYFVSATGANQLRELCERAEAPPTLENFKRSVESSGKLSDAFRRIVGMCEDSEETAFSFLKALRVRLQDHQGLIKIVERRIDGTLYLKDDTELQAGDVRRLLAEFILENLGNPIAAQEIGKFLADSGLGKRDWKSEPSITEAIATTNNRS